MNIFPFFKIGVVLLLLGGVLAGVVLQSISLAAGSWSILFLYAVDFILTLDFLSQFFKNFVFLPKL